jgi:hypothetical protein
MLPVDLCPEQRRLTHGPLHRPGPFLHISNPAAKFIVQNDEGVAMCLDIEEQICIFHHKML